MGRAKETAEEQLLRMIEGPGGPASSRSGLHHLSPERLLERLRGRIEGLWRVVFLPQQSGERSDGLLWRLRLAERVLWVVLACLGIYLVANLPFIHRRPPVLVVRTGPPAAAGSRSAAGALVEDQLKPLAAYREAIVTRNPFGLSTSEAVKTQETASKLTELTRPLTVVGVNRGRVPEALIEDTVAKRTYVVKVGEQINGVTVKSIGQNGVVVTYQDEETLLP